MLATKAASMTMETTILITMETLVMVSELIKQRYGWA
jgi:predicted peroxiredoxin